MLVGNEHGVLHVTWNIDPSPNDSLLVDPIRVYIDVGARDQLLRVVGKDDCGHTKCVLEDWDTFLAHHPADVGEDGVILDPSWRVGRDSKAIDVMLAKWRHWGLQPQPPPGTTADPSNRERPSGGGGGASQTADTGHGQLPSPTVPATRRPPATEQRPRAEVEHPGWTLDLDSDVMRTKFCLHVQTLCE